jgi:hypothetical protein
LYGRLPDIDIDRAWPIERVRRGECDIVVFGDLWRNWTPWLALRPHLGELRSKGVRLVGLDGSDWPLMYPYGPFWWREMRPWPPPRAHGRIAFFKRDPSRLTAFVRYYGLLPPQIAERRLARSVRPIAFSIPEDLLVDGQGPPRERLLATHVVDAEAAALTGSPTSYAFDTGEDYNADLHSARFGVTTKKAGWDCMRHYELAASGCIPCFRDLHAKPVRGAPHGLNETNCIAYRSADELLWQLERVSPDKEEQLRAGALTWAQQNTTLRRAECFLADVACE